MQEVECLRAELERLTQRNTNDCVWSNEDGVGKTCVVSSRQYEDPTIATSVDTQRGLRAAAAARVPVDVVEEVP